MQEHRKLKLGFKNLIRLGQIDGLQWPAYVSKCPQANLWTPAVYSVYDYSWILIGCSTISVWMGEYTHSIPPCSCPSFHPPAFQAYVQLWKKSWKQPEHCRVIQIRCMWCHHRGEMDRNDDGLCVCTPWHVIFSVLVSNTAWKGLTLASNGTLI